MDGFGNHRAISGLLKSSVNHGRLGVDSEVGAVELSSKNTALLLILLGEELEIIDFGRLDG